MVPAISKTSGLVQEIADSSSEQYSGVTQINTAMLQISQNTQSNAAGSEQLAATSQALNGQAENLQQLVGFFRMGSGVAASGRQPAKQTAVRAAASYA
jgi:methyl-accepting chemotaxis protein